MTVAPGEQAAKGAGCATIESVKAAAEVYLPVGGSVTRINEDLPKNPEQVNRDPYGAAWMVQIRIADPAELKVLMESSAYEAYCQERAT